MTIPEFIYELWKTDPMLWIFALSCIVIGFAPNIRKHFHSNQYAIAKEKAY